jgi:hypothetical protein
MQYSIRCLAAIALTAGMLFASPGQAMEIRQFDKMAIEDQKEYMGGLVEGAQQVLRDAGHTDLADKVETLFTTKPRDSDVSIGMSQLVANLALVRVSDLQRLEKDPNAKRLEVEHAMIMTLKHVGIVLPKSFMHVMDGFKPKHSTQ